MDLSRILLYISPPILGGLIGYYTNDIAIKMLFRPYKVLYIFGRKVPFTPGLIPSNQERLGQNIANAIMKSLLTPEEMQNLARKLLQPERMQGGIFWLLRLVVDQVKGDKNPRSTKILAGILRDLLGESLPRLLKVLARQETFLETQINQIFDQILLEFQLTQEQSNRLADWLLEAILPPDKLRQIIIDFLTDRTIQTIDESFREKTSGTYWVVANLFGLKNTLTRLRTFCLDEKEASNQRLQELIKELKMRDRLKELLQNLSLQNLPVGTVRQLRKTIRDSVRQYLQNSGSSLLKELTKSADWERISIVLLNRLSSSTVVNTSLEVVARDLALILEKYLEKDLEMIVAQAIPILSIDQVIVERVKATSPAELEAAIEGIVKNELQAIVTLGGVLGFVVGLLQVGFLFLSQSM
ncbi:MAG: DUF445 family protein [Anabaena sp. CoA2_C59]|uniref:DUF445 domain-containing protein n=1 Tax=Aphanizomenon flos-aquae TaxID=1176 RepID=UPI0007FC7A31|nr:DUF445 family protein [Aphanizomenon flos-aquae]MBD1218562.1 DUF445 family protein [Aphanizomenon flos-aquae Clear-A1]MBD2390559.1 DUF445 family protein [Aphanizomenon flos-aquae FACHB-1171]MBD2558237.1 DUF445 family protein [Aphanizomenon flos-aquae FACHB-1290]MBD2656625.1 DUF445 family protein [Aphanizomenon flos-aquae FACHB-1265]MBD2672460.1 DUF445 family protein [Aphanizomenon flos-aquae FACHB-1416]MCE2903444.1 DUF445 family protein [Anabaena sp. CoA2_C59]MDJ0505486.1 DUF445 family pr